MLLPALSDARQAAPDELNLALLPEAVEFTLSNGVRLVVSPDHRAPVVTHMIFYQVGAADEPPGHSGLAHFLEHLMFKGTTTKPGSAFDQQVAGAGGDHNALTDADYTAYFQQVARERLAEMMELEADRMSNLVLTDALVAVEREVVLNERREVIEESPDELLHEGLTRILYLNHPYGRPTIGWEHEIRALSRSTVLEFYRRNYRADNALVVVVGDVTPREVQRLAGQTYGRIPARAGPLRSARPAEPPSVGHRTISVAHVNASEPRLERAYFVPSVSAGEKQGAAIRVLAHIIGGGATSRFYDQLVRANGPATDALAAYEGGGLDHGRLVFYAQPKPGVPLMTLEEQIERVVDDLRQNGVNNAELQRAKRAVVAAEVYRLDDQQELALQLGEALAVGRSLDQVRNWPSTIMSVTAADVLAAANRFLSPEASATGYLLPKPE